MLALLALQWRGRPAAAGQSVATATAAPTPDGFRPGAAQLRTLGIEPAVEQEFHRTAVADGDIALDGDRTTPVFSPFTGRVTRVVAQPGDRVRRGAPLAWIDAAELVQAQDDLLTAAAQHGLARAVEARKHGLYAAQGGSLQDWQQAQADLATAGVALAAARSRLRVLGLDAAQIDALQAGGQVDAGAALRAPIDGVVVERRVGPGQNVQSGAAAPLYTVADLSSVWLVGHVREADAPAVAPGQPVEVSVTALPGRVFRARLDYVAAQLDPATHRLAVRARLRNPGDLKPGMFASFRIVSGDGMRSVAVPQSAVIHDGPDTHVWVVRGEGAQASISLRRITPGVTQAGLVQVLAGLAPGERVVTRGGLFIDHAVTGG